MRKRMCSFCGLTLDYNDMPDGTTVYLGICACPECLATDAAKKFRDLVENYQPEVIKKTSLNCYAIKEGKSITSRKNYF